MQMDRDLPKTLVPNRLELTIRMTMAAYKMGNRHQSCDYLAVAVRSALMTGNHLRYNEASDIYEQLLLQWSNEQRVKDLGSLFVQT